MASFYASVVTMLVGFGFTIAFTCVLIDVVKRAMRP